VINLQGNRAKLFWGLTRERSSNVEQGMLVQPDGLEQDANAALHVSPDQSKSLRLTFLKVCKTRIHTTSGNT
jgi:hypothetical protein